MIAESHSALQEAFATRLALDEDIDVVAVAASAREAVNLAWLHEPDVVLISIRLLGGSGFSVVEQLGTAVPKSRCILLTSADKPGYLGRAYEKGAWALLSITQTFTEIVQAIKKVHCGTRLISPPPDLSSRSPLTNRETEVLRAATQISTTAAIAKELHLSHGTINNYMSSILAKLGANNRMQAVMIAQSKGWL